MKRHYSLLLAFLALIVDEAPVSAQATQPASTTSARITRVEAGLRRARTIQGKPVALMRLDERMRHYKVPGVSIAVIDSFRIAWARGYGVREEGDSSRVTTETLFQAASISKPVAALAALRLVQDGKLSLDENVNLKLRSWKVPENEFTIQQPVTLRRLLSHGAGLTVHGFPGYASNVSVPSVRQVLDGQPPANTAAIRVDTVPGARWRYSGGGYTVMQQLIEDATGRPFADAMRTLVLTPVGMTRSTYEQPLPNALASNAASGHRSDGTLVQGKWYTHPEMAAAGLWTTPSDLARYAIEVQLAIAGRSNKVLSQATTAQMLTRQTGTSGLGPGLGGEANDATFSHGGANQGFRAYFIAFRERGQGAVVMTNADGGGALASEIVRAVAEEYNWPSSRPVEKTVVEVGPKTLSSLAGRYALETQPNFVITVTVDSGRITVDVPRQIRTEIYPESETKYFSLDQDLDFVFSAGDEGKITGFVLTAGSATYKAKRVD